MPRWALFILFCLSWAVSGSWVRAEGLDFPREHHVWARFAVGSWKLVRVTSETFDETGHHTGGSITETRTTLKEVTADGFSLLIESTVELAGKRIKAQPQLVTQRFNGTLPGQTCEVRELGKESLSIDGRNIECRVVQSEVSGPLSRMMTKTHYHDQIPPYTLRRESTTTDLPANVVSNQTIVEADSLEMPVKVKDRLLSAAHLRVTQRHLKGSELTLAVTCLEVPGGVVSHVSKQLDTGGRLVSRSILELVDYQAKLEPPLVRPTGLIRRTLGWLLCSQRRLADSTDVAALEAEPAMARVRRTVHRRSAGIR